MCPFDYEKNINMWVEKVLYLSLEHILLFMVVLYICTRSNEIYNRLDW